MLPFRLTLAALLLTSLPLVAATDHNAGKAIAMQGDGSGAPCITCHGLNGEGNAAAGFPRLDMLDSAYLIKQIQDYQAGKRRNALMDTTVDNLSAQQIMDVVAYYKSQKPSVIAAPTPNINLHALGEKLVLRGDWPNYIVPCGTCHGLGNAGVSSTFPALAGQHAEYIKQQLLAWKTGARSNDPDQLMLAIASRLTEQDIEAVASYLAQLPTSPNAK